MQPTHCRSIPAWWLLALPLVLLPGGCSGGGGDGAADGTVNTFISDPPTCMAPTGPFTNVWVTITRVRAHRSSTAGSGASGWVELVDLTNDPMQIDLLSLQDPNCILTMLGSASVPAGDYQQIRLHLLSNNPPPGVAVPSPNQCAGTGGYNCVVTSSAGPELLVLGSQDQTGLKIPPGQIAGGALTVQPGQAVDLNIDFDACRSILQQGNGTWRLKPTLNAGQVSINNLAISGRVVDQGTMNPVSNGTVVVAAEQQDAGGVDRIISQTMADPATGQFSLCPLPVGDYDIVVSAVDDMGNAFHPSVTFSVPVGTAMGDIPVTLVGGMTPTPATILGTVTSQNAGSMPEPVDAQVTAMQEVMMGGSPVQVTMPLLPASMAQITTEAGMACPTDTACADYTLVVPPGAPSAGTFSSGGTSYTTPAAGLVGYTVEARAFVPSSGGTPACSPSTLTTDQDNMGATLEVEGGSMVTAMTLSFTGCP